MALESEFLAMRTIDRVLKKVATDGGKKAQERVINWAYDKYNRVPEDMPENN